MSNKMQLMSLPAELIDEIMSRADPVTALNLACTCLEYSNRRYKVHPRFLPLIYNHRDSNEDLIRALKKKDEPGVRFILNYVNICRGLIVALEYKHNLAIDYLVAEAIILDESLPSHIIYYAYRACREDILARIVLDYDEYISTKTYKYCGLLASGRGELMVNYTIPLADLEAAYLLAYECGAVKLNEEFVTQPNSLFTRCYITFELIRVMIIRNENEHIEEFLKLRAQMDCADCYRAYIDGSHLCNIASEHGNNEALKILESAGFKKAEFPRKKIIDPDFKPEDDVLKYMRYGEEISFRTLAWLLPFAGGNRKQLMINVMNEWTCRLHKKEFVNLFITYPEAKEYANEHNIKSWLSDEQVAAVGELREQFGIDFNLHH